MIRTLIFDYDGTLHDTARLYGNAFRDAYRYLVSGGWAQEREYADEEVSGYLGMTAQEMWDRFMPQLPEAVRDEASAMIGSRMIAAIEDGGATLYPGTEATLDVLKEQGLEMVILLNCGSAYLAAHRVAFQLDRWFSGYYCSGDYAFAPKEEIFTVIRQRHPGQYVMIGDRASDLKVAEVHSIFSIACAYGFGGAEEWSSADRMIQSITQLPAQLHTLC